MSDLIDRQQAIKAIEDLQDCYNGFSDTYDKACIIGVLEEIPAADSDHVVRCKDCKYYSGMAYKTCIKIPYFWSEDGEGYCSCAERRTDETY